MKTNILIMGALGQIGTELTSALRKEYGVDKVIASDIRIPAYEVSQEGPYEIVDCTDPLQTAAVVVRHQVKTIYNLPALLSATAEQYPQKAFEVNLIGLHHTLEVAREFGCSVFTPSTIGVFGNETPKKNTPQTTIMRPHTMYGVTKVTGELLSDYYYYKYGLDTRGVRFPGIISYRTFPGGGTTDYAVSIYFDAVQRGSYTSYLKPDTYLDMLYMPDAIDAAIDLMRADPEKLRVRNAYNITSMSLDVCTIEKEIKKHIPTFKVDYSIDPVRQSIAESWPESLDDHMARDDWGWSPKWDLENMTSDMLHHINNSTS